MSDRERNAMAAPSSRGCISPKCTAAGHVLSGCISPKCTAAGQVLSGCISPKCTTVWLAALALWLVASALTCWLYPLTMIDSCQRYAPMADAFARGDFYYAFHPRFGILFEIVAGGIALLTGLPGIYAVQVAAFLFLALTAVVVFFFAKRLGGSDEAAWWSFVLAFLAPDFFRYALDGLRDPSKCLVYALIGYALAAQCRRGILPRHDGNGRDSSCSDAARCRVYGEIRVSLPFALALFVYITSFTYGFAAASAFVFLWCLWFAWKREWKMLPLPILGWLSGTAAVTVLTHAYTGHWLPVPQFIDKLGAWL